MSEARVIEIARELRDTLRRSETFIASTPEEPFVRFTSSDEPQRQADALAALCDLAEAAVAWAEGSPDYDEQRRKESVLFAAIKRAHPALKEP